MITDRSPLTLSLGLLLRKLHEIFSGSEVIKGEPGLLRAKKVKLLFREDTEEKGDYR